MIRKLQSQNYQLSLPFLFFIVICFFSSATFSQFTWKTNSRGYQPSNTLNKFNEGDVNNMYNDFKQYYIEDGLHNNTEARVKWGSGGLTADDSKYTASEGMGYGMLMAAYAKDRGLFNRLFKFYKSSWKYGGSSRRLMPWLVDKNHKPYDPLGGGGPATDGDMDVAMALLIAHDNWGGTYKQQAKYIIDIIHDNYLQYCSSTNVWVVRPYGDTANSDGWDACNNEHDLSYQISAFFRIFSSVGKSDQYNRWINAANNAYSNQMLKKSSRVLPPDWSVFPNSSNPVTSHRNENYASDASRIPWRVALDYLWHNKWVAKNWINTVTGVVDTQGGINAIKADMNPTNGSVLTGTYNGLSFSGGFTVGAMAKSKSKIDNFANNWKGEYYSKRDNHGFDLSTSNKNNSNDYYGLATSVLYAMTLSGNFWKPNTANKGAIVDDEKNINENNILSSNSINIYPNPVSNALNIDISGLKSNKFYKIDVYDLRGRNVLTMSKSSSSIELNVSDLPSGSYMLKISGEQINETKRFIKLL